MKSLGFISHLECLFHTVPQYSSFKAFGCSCYPWLRLYNSNKLQPRTKQCVFLGYSLSQKGYRCLDPIIGHLYLSLHVGFDETSFPFASSCSTSYLSSALFFLIGYQAPLLLLSSLLLPHFFLHQPLLLLHWFLYQCLLPFLCLGPFSHQQVRFLLLVPLHQILLHLPFLFKKIHFPLLLLHPLLMFHPLLPLPLPLCALFPLITTPWSLGLKLGFLKRKFSYLQTSCNPTAYHFLLLYYRTF